MKKEDIEKELIHRGFDRPYGHFSNVWVRGTIEIELKDDRINAIRFCRGYTRTLYNTTLDNVSVVGDKLRITDPYKLCP